MSQLEHSNLSPQNNLTYEPEQIELSDGVSLMGYDDKLIKPEGRRGDGVAKYAAWISICIFVGTTWIIILSNQPGSLGWYAFHPTMQSLSIALFTYGILTLQPTSQPKTKAAGLVRHQLIIAVVGFPLFVIGTLAIIYHKTLRESHHFKSWHGIFGIISFAWLTMQILLGGGSVWFNGAAFGGGPKAKAIWKLSGYMLYPLMLLTAHLGGAWSNWVSSHSAYAFQLIAFTVAPVVLFAAILTRVRPSKMKFL